MIEFVRFMRSSVIIWPASGSLDGRFVAVCNAGTSMHTFFGEEDGICHDGIFVAVIETQFDESDAWFEMMQIEHMLSQEL